jgi:hypothetical protein
MERVSGERRGAGFNSGRRELARHRPDLAVHNLRLAVASCPATRSGELSRNLYWLALALLRLDKPELAIRSLASAQKLRPRGIARKAYERRINAYGMCRRASPELDDFHAFYSIQAGAYLRRKEKGRFESNAEKDVITRLIGDAWRSLSRSCGMDGLTASRKLELFRKRRIAFPLFGLGTTDQGAVLEADFRRGTRLRGDERCRCGSGLPFIRCCGRIPSTREGICE